MRALITRPREDAERIAAPLRARGIGVFVEPLLTITPLPAPLDLDGVQALLFTSANGVRVLARTADADEDTPAGERARSLPALCVGDATAREARCAGFSRVETAGGDVESLARLTRARLNPADGVLLHAAGRVTAGDLKGRLEACGFTVRRTALYEAHPSERLSRGLKAALGDGKIHLALFFSPRTGETFARLIRREGLADGLQSLRAYCLSPAVADTIKSLPWRALLVADAPTQAALLACLDQDLANEPGPTGEAKPPTGERP